MKYTYVLKAVTLSGDMLIEKNTFPFILTKGAEQFKLAFPASSIDDMDAFEAFCIQEDQNFHMLFWTITIKRLEGPLEGSTIFPANFITWESAQDYLIEIAKTLNGDINKFHITLEFGDGLAATCYTSLGEPTLLDEEEPFDLLKFWTGEMEYLRKYSWLQREKEGLAQILERIPWITPKKETVVLMEPSTVVDQSPVNVQDEGREHGQAA